jgi:Na+/phosphate symporter
MDIFLLYLFTRLGPLHTALFVAIAITGVGIFISALAPMGESQQFKDDCAKWRSRSIVAFLLFGAVKVFIPTQSDAALILAGSAVIDVAKSETAGRLASKSVQLIEQTLDGYLKKPEK